MQEVLFTIIGQPQLSAEQKRLLQVIRNRPTTAEVHIARLANAPATLLEKGKAVVLNMAPGKQFVAVGEKEIRRTDNISWAGSLQNQDGQITLVSTTKGITGSIRSNTVFYMFEPIGEGLQALIRLDPSKRIPEHSPKYPSGVLIDTASAWTGDAVQLNRNISSTSSVTPLSHNSGPYIDVLVVYTPSAASATSDINGLIQTAVDETDVSYANSNIGANINLVHTAQASYNESGRSFQQHLNAMQDRSDGIMDNINSLRNQYLADVVVLIVNDTDGGITCGRAYEIMARMNTAFAAVHYDCARGPIYYSFAHEIGHLQGARHDRTVDPNNEPFQYGHGYVDPNDNWRTIMAYDDACNGCQRVQYWSSPLVNYPPTGQAMGTSTYEDNARVLDLTKYDIRDFKTLPPPTDFILTNGYSYGDPPHFTWTAVPGADWHNVHRCISGTGYYPPSCFYPIGDGLNEFTDWNVTIVDPYAPPYYGDCPEWAKYYVTAQNRTGESGYYNTQTVCVESPYY